MKKDNASVLAGLILIRENLEYYREERNCYGICDVLEVMDNEGNNSLLLVSKYLKENLPTHAELTYCWDIYDLNSRLDWLDSHILKLREDE